MLIHSATQLLTLPGGHLAWPRPGRAAGTPALWLWFPGGRGGGGGVLCAGAAGLAEIAEKPDGDDVSDLVDSLCALAKHHKIYFLWRPSLPDANDELILELAVSAQCDYIVTHNLSDFKGVEKFGVKAVTPGAFLRIIGEV